MILYKNISFNHTWRYYTKAFHLFTLDDIIQKHFPSVGQPALLQRDWLIGIFLEDSARVRAHLRVVHCVCGLEWSGVDCIVCVEWIRVECIVFKVNWRWVQRAVHCVWIRVGCIVCLEWIGGECIVCPKGKWGEAHCVWIGMEWIVCLDWRWVHCVSGRQVRGSALCLEWIGDECIVCPKDK